MYDMVECKYVQLLIEFEDAVQCLLIYMSLGCLFIDPHQLHTNQIQVSNQEKSLIKIRIAFEVM